MDTNQIIRIQEVVNYINGNVRQAIQNRVAWYRYNLPPYAPDNAPGDLSWTRDLSSVSVKNNTSAGNVAQIANLYRSIQEVFVTWCYVRPITMDYYTWNNNNGQDITWNHAGSWTNLGKFNGTNTNMANNEFSKIGGHTNDILRANHIRDLSNQLYAAWERVSNANHVYWSRRQQCHDNCHQSCHGSGGKR